MSNPNVTIANAPISWGAFELTVGVLDSVPDADRLLDLLVEADFHGVDLGPVGFFGRGDVLHRSLASRGLGLAGGYIELPFSDHDRLEATFPELDHLLEAFDEAGALSGPRPRPTIADAGAPHRRSHPGRSANDRSLGLDDAAWKRWAVGMARTIERCRTRGYEPTLHPETGTYIEAPWEIDRALELTEIGLCLETGHQAIGGGDPFESMQRWGDRINHVHVKDAKLHVMSRIIADEMPVESIWSERAFCALGEGDVRVDEILSGLDTIGYTGWLVVEQDIMPGPGDPDAAQAAQHANRKVLAAHGF